MRTHSEEVGINIDPSKLCFIITKAREFDAKVDPVKSDSGYNEAGGGEREILEGYADDPALKELRDAIDVLNEDEIVDLIALTWLGRGDFTRNEWARARSLAREVYCWHSASYLIAMPALGDFLEKGLAELEPLMASKSADPHFPGKLASGSGRP
jgi:hypothetical protein